MADDAGATPVAAEEAAHGNTIARFWKLRGEAGLRPSSTLAVPPALRRFEPDAFLYGACAPNWDGSVPPRHQLPFDPDEVFENYLFERYAENSMALRGAYYRVRPLVPIALRRTLQRWHARRRDATRFPRWPVELSLIRFQQLLLRSLLRDVSELPHVALWPGDRRFALVLTHDVDSAEGFARIESVARVERDLGFRSAWFIVPELYRVDWDYLARLVEDGFEIGIHGLKHDGRLFESREIFASRLSRINEHVRRAGAVGFRSPATLRRPEWLREVAVEYDASYFDTDPFEPQPGGTCSWFPFFLGGLVELPYTLPQDFTLFEKLRLDAADVWIRKLELIERFRGMALLLTHPDYLDRHERLDAYRRALQWVAKRANCWHALPREVAAWWRARAAATWRGDGTIETAERWHRWANELRPGVIRWHGRQADGEPLW